MTAKTWIALLGISLSGVACNQMKAGANGSDKSEPAEAICVLEPTKGNDVTGTISILQKGGDVHIAGEVRKLSPGKHGFHVHEFGDLRAEDGSTTGGHYNPSHQEHGGLDAPHHHLGDLGNITANDDGVALIDMIAHGLKTSSIIGRSLVVHAKADDLHTQPSGDSGPRVAVGVIGFRQITPATP